MSLRRAAARRRHEASMLVLGALVIAACTGTPGAGADGPSGEDSSEPPNVLLIVTDDQRAEGTFEVMPRLRRYFQEEGTTFTDALATTPLCCPSRASIFSGRYSHNTRVSRNQEGYKLAERSTIQYYLRKAGYRTALVGKYLQGVRQLDTPPNFHDFAVSGGLLYFDRLTNVQGTVRRVHRYQTDFLGDVSVRFLEDFERDDRRPWFLYIAPNAPHGPFVPAPRHEKAPVPEWRGSPATRELDLSDKPPYVRNSSFRLGDPELIWRQQLRTLLSVDDMLGRIFSAMRRLGEERDTLAIYMSDNGLLLGEHRFFAKRVPYQASVAIPLLMRWPGHVASGEEDDRLAANIDVAPTIMDAAGIEPDPRFPVDGTSLLSDRRRDQLLLEEYENEVHDLPWGWASIRTKSYRYTEYYASDGSSVLYREYYALESDPYELTNLLGDGERGNDPAVEELARRLARLRRCEGSSCP